MLKKLLLTMFVSAFFITAANHAVGQSPCNGDLSTVTTAVIADDGTVIGGTLRCLSVNLGIGSDVQLFSDNEHNYALLRVDTDDPVLGAHSVADYVGVDIYWNVMF